MRSVGEVRRGFVRALGSLLLALLGAALLACTATAQLTSASPVTRGSGYLALGDSITFGYQEPGVRPVPDYRRAASFRGYPEQVGTELHLKVTNLACPGETAASLIDVKAPNVGCESAYRKALPLHVGYSGSQLAAAVAYLRRHRDVRLVSLMIGANDLLRCQADTADACRAASERGATLASITRNVNRILSTVRNQAGYHGQLVILNYYAFSYAAPATVEFSRQLNHAQDTPARRFGARFADGLGEWRAASRQFASSPCLAGLLTQLGSYGTCGIHPSYAGQALLAKAMVRAIRF